MALLRCNFASEVLQMDTAMTVILPQDGATPFSDPPSVIETAPPVLYLLHGAGDNSTSWSRCTALERYVEPYGLAVVMPEVGRSFYTDQVHGQRYWTYLTEELPVLVESLLQVSTQRADTFVAGLSMGGYGAIKWALRQPDRFAAAASLSGVLDIARVRRSREPHREPTLHAAFGEHDLTGTDEDLLHLLSSGARSAKPLPDLLLACGEGDALFADNIRFITAATDLNIAVTSDLGPGEHTWAYWDAAIQRVLAWLPVRGPVPS